MSRYTYLAADLLTGVIREEVPLTSIAFSHELNGPGGFTASCPMEALDQFGYNRVTRAVLDPARTIIHVLRDGQHIWAGVLWSVQAAVDDDATIELAGQGLWSYAARRELDRTLTWANTEQFTIAETLAEEPLIGMSDPLYSVSYDAASGILRDRTYWAYERKNLAEAVEQLSAVINGFDFGFVHSGTMETGLNTAMKLSYPARGRQTALVFETKKNIRVMNWSLDGWAMANRWTALGSGEGSTMLIATVADPSKLTSYPRLDGSSAHKDVSIFATLDGHARAGLKEHASGVETIVVEVLPGDVDATLGSFITGDRIKVRAERGYVDIDAYFRVMSWAAKVDNSGREQLQVAMSAAEATV